MNSDMSFFLTNLLIGIGLSMDAFSLSILYGTLNLKKSKILWLSIIVGIYHFLMPLLGSLIGNHVLANYIPDPEFLIGVIFTVISVQMLFSIKKEEEVKTLKGIGSLLLFGFTVSIDSFSIGMGFGTLKNSLLRTFLSSLIYSFTSLLFTYLGLNIGTSLTKKFGKIATFFGSILLLAIAIHYFLI